MSGFVLSGPPYAFMPCSGKLFFNFLYLTTKSQKYYLYNIAPSVIVAHIGCNIIPVSCLKFSEVYLTHLTIVLFSIF
jgi:tellurite resistance protein TehA-like permease